MELTECTIGKIVYLKSTGFGHIVGLTFNLDIKNIGSLSQAELDSRTIPLVKFPGEEFPRGVHQANLECI